MGPPSRDFKCKNVIADVIAQRDAQESRGERGRPLCSPYHDVVYSHLGREVPSSNRMHWSIYSRPNRYIQQVHLSLGLASVRYVLWVVGARLSDCPKKCQCTSVLGGPPLQHSPVLHVARHRGCGFLREPLCSTPGREGGRPGQALSRGRLSETLPPPPLHFFPTHRLSDSPKKRQFCHKSRLPSNCLPATAHRPNADEAAAHGSCRRPVPRQ